MPTPGVNVFLSLFDATRRIMFADELLLQFLSERYTDHTIYEYPAWAMIDQKLDETEVIYLVRDTATMPETLRPKFAALRPCNNYLIYWRDPEHWVIGAPTQLLEVAQQFKLWKFHSYRWALSAGKTIDRSTFSLIAP